MGKTWTILAMLEWATSYFERHGVASPRMSIEWLLADILDVKRLNLYLTYDRPLSPSELDKLRPLVKRRARHEPLQYITGYTHFMDIELDVTPDALIPRMETEQLVEIIIETYDDRKSEPLRFLDVGTGTGCIPIAIKQKRANWLAEAIDISEPALELARHNARKNNTEITFSKIDLFELSDHYTEASFNFIVSNPPYISPEEKESLDPQVKNFEPHLALFTNDVEQMYGSLFKSAAQLLKAGGYLFLEIHQHRADEIISTIKNSTAWNTTLQKDYDDNNRFIICELNQLS